MDYIRDKALNGEFLAGAWSNLTTPICAEMAGALGYDWILLDQEHGPGDNMTLLHQIQAAARFPATVVVRLPWVDRILIKRTLDLGAGGIMIPYVQTPEEAREVVKLAKYVPEGERGVAGSPRCSDYSINFKNYFANANRQLITMVQIETRKSVDNAEAIAAVDGVDVLFVGPLDLSISTGMPDMFSDPGYIDVLKHIVNAAKKYGKAGGIVLPNTGLIPRVKELGFTVIAIGNDGAAVLNAYRSSLECLRA